MKWPSFTFLISGAFIAYIAHSIWTLYSLFNPPPCPPKGECLKPYLANKNPKFELSVYTSKSAEVKSLNGLQLIWNYDNFTVDTYIEKELNVSVPLKTRRNGTLYTHVFLHQRGVKPFQSQLMVNSHSLLTTYSVPKSATFSLLGEADDSKKGKKNGPRGTPITHWRQKLVINVMSSDIHLDRYAVPNELYPYLRLTQQGDYLPILFIDQMSNRIKDLLPVNESSKVMPLTITYSPISVGKLRMWVNMQESMKMLHQLGFTEKDTDEMKGIFADTNFTFLCLTFGVAALHLLFDFLAFKNDISYWKKRDTMVGLSTRVVVWRCVSTFIIFLYLMDEETSLLVLVPAGIGTLIEVWKVKKAFKVSVTWSGLRPSFQFGSTSDQEKKTQEFDSLAMKYLSYVLYPLVLAGAIYSLIYTPHKSWYSWCVQSLVNGVYAFGFLFMLPQLFVNYKLKSVAHLPWRAFMYKAFNTFIDDIFAFVITMPTAHRLACFRDDVVFLIYLYQRWLYPVDKKRVNEYGQSFDEAGAGEKPKKE